MRALPRRRTNHSPAETPSHVAPRWGGALGATVFALAAIAASTGCSKAKPTGDQAADKPAAAAPKTATPAEPPAKPPEPEKIKLTINDFGVFGYKPLYAEYQKSHPNIEIVESVNEYNTHHTNLINQLAAGNGDADSEAS